MHAKSMYAVFVCGMPSCPFRLRRTRRWLGSKLTSRSAFSRLHTLSVFTHQRPPTCPHVLRPSPRQKETPSAQTRSTPWPVSSRIEASTRLGASHWHSIVLRGNHRNLAP
ncbi:hypothetical protein CCHR01_08501 [Colletotrichum chrysophilum]|uniref:Uncharacterized protein n=1 Tax=Colletotrichum chrysophilum TaxID=1836956 RepID=A0AAD9EIL4_9PEZI|nr:hypothetical protein CCHR01_08501 [Colletotrichum chrysophilum]